VRTVLENKLNTFSVFVFYFKNSRPNAHLDSRIPKCVLPNRLPGPRKTFCPHHDPVLKVLRRTQNLYKLKSKSKKVAVKAQKQLLGTIFLHNHKSLCLPLRIRVPSVWGYSLLHQTHLFIEFNFRAYN
jgi:hypothetical protein